MRYLGIAFVIALLLACGTPSAVQPTIAPVDTPESQAAATAAPVVLEAATDAGAPTAEVLASLATDAPAELATDAPLATEQEAAAPTDAPIPGAAPNGKDCPADHPVKGNIVDRGANKGEKIYHLPGDNGYAQTKPEQCFADAKEAEQAGFRAVKK